MGEHYEVDEPSSEEPFVSEVNVDVENTRIDEGTGESRPKPLLSRCLNRLGVPTGPVLDWVLDWTLVLALTIGLTAAIMQVGLARMTVPTGSMSPTIEPGDSFFVDKFTYWSGLNHPKTGDIVVFWHTETVGSCERGMLFWQWEEPAPCDQRLVKRLVTIGPAQVEIRYGDLYVDGEKLSDPAFDRSYMCRGTYESDGAGCIWEVPEGEMFVLGDNSGNSLDSRYWGTEPLDRLIGEPFLRVWPVERAGLMNGTFGIGPP